MYAEGHEMHDDPGNISFVNVNGCSHVAVSDSTSEEMRECVKDVQTALLCWLHCIVLHHFHVGWSCWLHSTDMNMVALPSFSCMLLLKV